MDNYINGKVIIITGAGSGFGKLTAEMASEMGGKIVCADINQGNLEAVTQSIKEKGYEATGIVTDVSKKDQVNAMAKSAIDAYGRIDVLINNAGTMPLSYYSDHAAAWEAWDKCIDINLKGTIYGISAVYDQMMKQGQGHIINMSSIYDNAPVMGSAVYQATKIGVRYLSEVLRQESQGTIKVSTVKPTGVLSTGLVGTVINKNANKGIYGAKYPDGSQRSVMMMENKDLPAEYFDINSAQYWRLHPEAIAENIIYCINQPWGVSVSDITVRATGELYAI